MSTPTVIAVTEDLTADWLTGVIGGGSVGAFETTRIGTGQMSESHRVRVRYDDGGGPESVVLKIAASDETSRSTGVSLGLYEREVRFYADIAGSIGPGALARCHHASYEADSGTFALVLEDAGPAEVGNDILGATLGQAELAVRALARIQSAVLGNDELAATDWLNREAPINQALLASLFPAFLDRYGSRLDPRHRDLAQQMVDSWDAYLAEQQAMPHQSLIHGDFRLDNLLFGQPGAARPVTVVDWQTVAWGPATNDLAYFLGASLPTELRRAHFDDLLQIYFDGLGGRGPASVDEVRDGVRRHTFFGILMTIVPSVIVEQTDRGDEMFMTMFARHCELALDLESAATLPAARALEPLAPEPTDEFAHTPGRRTAVERELVFRRRRRRGRSRRLRPDRGDPQPEELLVHRDDLRAWAPDRRRPRLRSAHSAGSELVHRESAGNSPFRRTPHHRFGDPAGARRGVRRSRSNPARTSMAGLSRCAWTCNSPARATRTGTA